jgi:hypothetical protein
VRVVTGDPKADYISTCYVERQNLTMRMSMRRFTRLTNAFSKKVENLAAAVSLHFMHYNFGRPHSSLGRNVTPAMAAGVTDHVWTATRSRPCSARGTTLVLVDPLAFTLAVTTPGIAVTAAAMVLLVRTSIRSRMPSVWGLRLLYLGLGLMNLVPGVAIIAAVLVGRLMWPAALGGLVGALLGSGILYGLRLWWDDPAHGRLGDSRGPN